MTRHILELPRHKILCLCYTHFGLVLDTRRHIMPLRVYYTPKACITWSKFIAGLDNGQTRRKRANSTFVLFTIRAHLMSSLVNNATSSMQCNTHTHTTLPHCACQKHNNCISTFGQKTHTKCLHLIVGKTLKNHLSTLARKKKPTPNAPCWKITKRAPCKVAISPQACAATAFWNYLKLLYKNKKLKIPAQVQLSAKLVWAWFKWHTNEFLFSLDLCVKNPCRLGHLSPLPKNTGWVDSLLPN
jgi:hypothetical protein